MCGFTMTSPICWGGAHGAATAQDQSCLEPRIREWSRTQAQIVTALYKIDDFVAKRKVEPDLRVEREKIVDQTRKMGARKVIERTEAYDTAERTVA